MSYFLLSTCSPLGWACSDCFISFPFFCSNDLAWDGESKRIIAVGDGKEKSVQPFTSDVGAIRQSQNLFVLVETRFGHAFLVDMGSSTGEILGHSKVRYSTLS